MCSFYYIWHFLAYDSRRLTAVMTIANQILAMTRISIVRDSPSDTGYDYRILALLRQELANQILAMTIGF